MTGSGIGTGRSSRCLLPSLIVFLLYMAMSMGISLLDVSDSFSTTVLSTLLVIAEWLVMPAAVVIYNVSNITSRQWRLAFSALAAIGLIIGMTPLLSIIGLEIRLGRRMPSYLKTIAELPLPERTFHASEWGGWAGGTDKFFIYS